MAGAPARRPPSERGRHKAPPPPPARPGAVLMPRIARGSVDQVQAAADMVEVVSQYTDLRKAGANYSGRCPSTRRRRLSFSVNPTEKLYYCFGCGAGGNLFGFVQQKESLDFAAAVEYLADKYGVRAGVRGVVGAGRRRSATAASGCGRCSSRPPPTTSACWRPPRRRAPAREYLAERGLGDEVCRAFRVGYSPGRLGQAARRRRWRAASPSRSCWTPASSYRASAAGPTTASAAASSSRWPTTAAAPWASARAPSATRSPSTSTHPRRRSTTRARPCSACTGRKRRAPRAPTASTWSRATRTSWPWPRRAWPTWWPAWARRSRSSSSRASSRVTRNLYLCFDADAAGIGAMQRALVAGAAHGPHPARHAHPRRAGPGRLRAFRGRGEGFRRLADEAQTLLRFHVREALATHDLHKPDGRARAFARLRGVLSEAATPLERDEEMRFIRIVCGCPMKLRVTSC